MTAVLAQAAPQDSRGLTLAAFAVILSITLGVTFWAARRTRTASDFWAAGRSISGAQNGLAIAGDLMSAAAFLGFTGLIYLTGFDGWIPAAVTVPSFVLTLLLLAGRMRNAGKFTVADVLSYRLAARPVRAVTAVTTLLIVVGYLIAQLVGAGVLVQVLTGISFAPAVVLTGVFMLVYVVFGGMIATTWVQIIKAVLLLASGLLLFVLVLNRFGFDLSRVLTTAAARHPGGDGYLGGGGGGMPRAEVISFALTFFVGTAALPHILIRFFTVPTAKAARQSIAWAAGAVGVFLFFISVVGFGARAILGPGAVEAVGPGGNLASPLLAQELGGGADSVGGDLLLATVSAVAFATILAVVSGLILAASGAAAHDLWSNLLERRRAAEDDETRVARIAAACIGVLAVALTIGVGPGFNVAVLVGMTLSVAASANFPSLLLALTWRRFNTTGALAGIATGLVSSIALIVLSPDVWPGAGDSPWPISYPTLVSLPLGFAACWLGTVVAGGREGERSFSELHVRAETGLGAEGSPGGPAPRRGPPVAAG